MRFVRNLQFSKLKYDFIVWNENNNYFHILNHGHISKIEKIFRWSRL
eukprot:UN24124